MPILRGFDIEYNVSGRTKEKNKNTFQYKISSKLTSEKTKELKMNDQSKQKLRIGYIKLKLSLQKRLDFRKKTHHIYIKQYQLCIKWQIMPNMAY